MFYGIVYMYNYTITLFVTRCQTRLLEKDMEWKKREKLMTYFINVMKVGVANN